MRLKYLLVANVLLVTTLWAQDDDAFLTKYAPTFETAATVPGLLDLVQRNKAENHAENGPDNAQPADR